MKIVPTTLRAANAFVSQHHRHHPAVRGCKFCFAVQVGEAIVGVAIVGRPVARMADDGFTLEVNRTCTVEAKNANSKLYGCAARVARELGYRLIITYTLPSESGDSLRAAGWVCKGPAGGGSWSSKKRARGDNAPIETKIRWEKTL